MVIQTSSEESGECLSDTETISETPMTQQPPADQATAADDGGAEDSSDLNQAIYVSSSEGEDEYPVISPPKRTRTSMPTLKDSDGYETDFYEDCCKLIPLFHSCMGIIMSISTITSSNKNEKTDIFLPAWDAEPLNGAGSFAKSQDAGIMVSTQANCKFIACSITSTKTTIYL